MKFAFRLIALAFAVGLNIYYWQWLGRPVELPDVPNARYDCLSYTAYSDGHDPTDPNTSVSMDIIDADLKALSQITNCIRVYSARGSTPFTLEAAKKHQIKVILGAWVGGDHDNNRAEIDNVIKLANQYADNVKMVVVGNEVLLRQELHYQQLGNFITEVKKHIPVPVAYADVYDFWIQYPQMADFVDVILVHILPYWGDPAPTSTQAQHVVESSLQDFLQRFKGRNIMIGETGWPSAGPSRQEAVASVVDQARFVRNFIQSAHTLHVPYNLIEALDQPWKRSHEGTVGGYWGIKNVERENKFPLTGPVSEWPNWKYHVAIAITLGILISTASLRLTSSFAMIMMISMASQMIGTLSIFIWRMAQETSQTYFGLFFNHAAILLVLLSSALAFWQLVQHKQNQPPLSFNTVLNQRTAINWTSLATIQSLLLFIGTFAAAGITLSLAIEMRHQDIPWPMFAGTALLAITTLIINKKQQHQPQGRIEAWLATILLLSAPWCFDGWDNEPAMIWQLTAILIALPWLSAIKHEIRLLVRE